MLCRKAAILLIMVSFRSFIFSFRFTSFSNPEFSLIFALFKFNLNKH